MAGRRPGLTRTVARAALARLIGAKLALLGAGLATFALVGLFAFLALFGVVAGGQAQGQALACGVSGQGRAEIPAELLPIYERAAARYRLGERGVAVLAAINKIETGFGTNQGPSSAGALGWMQFMPATWAAYGVDADADGRRDPADPDDAIHAAANYLRASGAPRSWYSAIFAYNHADWYLQDVLALADGYQGECELLEPSISVGDLDFSDTSGAWSGSRKFARELAGLGRRHGCTPISEKRDRQYTASGGISDHWVGSRDAYAVDIDSGGCTMAYPGGDADRTAKAIAAVLGMPAHTGIQNTVRGSYRFQLLWQTDGHYDHVHIGVSRIGAGGS